MYSILRISKYNFVCCQYITYRSSIYGKGSDASHNGTFLKKYRPDVKKNTSAIDLEEAFPFGLGNKLYDTFQNGHSDLIENKAFERIVGNKAVLYAASPGIFERSS